MTDGEAATCRRPRPEGKGGRRKDESEGGFSDSSFLLPPSRSGAMLHIALWEPEIPPNTGNIARLCAATGAALHLIGRLGFHLDDRSLKRAGLDYWQAVAVREHRTLEEFEEF